MKSETRDYEFGAVVLAIALGLCLLLVGYVWWGSLGDSGYYSDGIIPNGWYCQRQYINASYMVRGDEIMFAVCDHPGLGPLHGDWKLGANVTFGECGWYNLRLESGVIVEAVLRQRGEG